jgi:hypothetical protein
MKRTRPSHLMAYELGTKKRGPDCNIWIVRRSRTGIRYWDMFENKDYKKSKTR